MTQQPEAGGETLANKLDELFRKGHPGGRGEYTYEEVAEGIRRQGGPTISATYLWELRTGKKDNPRKRHLEAIAAFFGISPEYFFDTKTAERISAQLDLFAAMRDAGVRDLALRAAELSPEALRTIARVIELARRSEGLPGRTETGTMGDTE